MSKDRTKIFKALSDLNRLRILKMLQTKPLCVCEITEILQLATSTVSKHLSILKEESFIIEQKEGKWVNYLNNNSTVSESNKTSKWKNVKELWENEYKKLLLIIILFLIAYFLPIKFERFNEAI